MITKFKDITLIYICETLKANAPSHLRYYEKHSHPKFSSSFLLNCMFVADLSSMYESDNHVHLLLHHLYCFQVHPRYNLFRKDTIPRLCEIRPRLFSTNT